MSSAYSYNVSKLKTDADVEYRMACSRYDNRLGQYTDRNIIMSIYHMEKANFHMLNAILEKMRE